jgi:hypothetical protein
VQTVPATGSSFAALLLVRDLPDKLWREPIYLSQHGGRTSSRWTGNGNSREEARGFD